MSWSSRANCLQEDLKATLSQLEETQQKAKALRLQLEALQHAEPKAAPSRQGPAAGNSCRAGARRQAAALSPILGAHACPDSVVGQQRGRDGAGCLRVRRSGSVVGQQSVHL